MNQANKSQTEIKIVKKFAAICPYKIKIDSIKKTDPPKPDIYCELDNGKSISFELVEILDKSIAETISNQTSLKCYLDKTKNNLPTNERKIFDYKYKNALIYISFNKGFSLNKKKGSIPKIINFLLGIKRNKLSKDFETKISNCPEVDNINIRIGCYQGPMFRVDGVTSFGIPIIKKIKDKFCKSYQTDNKIDLLAYFALQPEISESHWLPETIKYIKDNINDSPFESVWIYSYTKNNVLYSYKK